MKPLVFGERSNWSLREVNTDDKPLLFVLHQTDQNLTETENDIRKLLAYRNNLNQQT